MGRDVACARRLVAAWSKERLNSTPAEPHDRIAMPSAAMPDSAMRLRAIVVHQLSHSVMPGLSFDKVCRFGGRVVTDDRDASLGKAVGVPMPVRREVATDLHCRPAKAWLTKTLHDRVQESVELKIGVGVRADAIEQS